MLWDDRIDAYGKVLYGEGKVFDVRGVTKVDDRLVVTFPRGRSPGDRPRRSSEEEPWRTPKSQTCSTRSPI